MRPVRIAAVQFEVGQDVSVNLASCLRMIDAAAAEGASIIVLPEFCNHLSWYDSRVTAHERACRLDDDFLAAIAERAVRHGAYIKINVTVARPDGRTTGTNLMYDPSGALIGQSDKLTLMGAEGDHLEVGETAGPVLETEHGRLGMYACMEGVTSEVCRDLSLRGSQILLNSLNSFALDEASLHIPVRAAENRVWVVAANKVGPLLPADLLPAIGAKLGVPPEWLHGAGESQIVAPDGTVLAKGPRTGEAVVVADVDPGLADDKARPDGTNVITARRPELYAPITSPPQAREAAPGVPELSVAVLAADDLSDASALVTRAADAGARLIVLPELAFGADCAPAEATAALAKAVQGTDAHVVVSLRNGGAHAGHLINADGLVGRQLQLHAGERLSGWVTEHGDGVEVFELPWGRLAIVVGDDALYPETFRLAAIADADVVAVPFTRQEAWELELGLPERSAENRLNVVAASGDDGLICALPADFTLWTAWEGPFTGRISHPIITRAEGPITLGTVFPARAVNREVSKNTDLVGGRPWRAVGSLSESRR